jgi:GT2 family glycosyltransferase
MKGTCTHSPSWEDGVVISVLVLNWNGREYLSACITSVLEDACPHVEVLVVDNGSVDGSAVDVSLQFPEVRIVRHSSNLGFSQGYNRAAPEARGRVIVFLNNDTIVTPGWLGHLASELLSDPAVGVACSRVLFLDGSVINSLGGQLRLWTGSQELGYGQDKAFLEARRIVEPFYASGASMAIRRDLFNELNGFDPLIFAYGEDLDICWRARLRGYRVICVMESIVYHHGSAAWGIFNPKKVQLVTYGQIRAMVKSLSLRNLSHSIPAYVAFAVMKGIVISTLKRNPRYLIAVLAAFGAILNNLSDLRKERTRTQATRRFPDAVALKSEGFGLAVSPIEAWRVIRVAVSGGGLPRDRHVKDQMSRSITSSSHRQPRK